MKGKIITIEGCDSTGKETQARSLVSYLNSVGIKASYESFPNYKSESSYFVKRYLGGYYSDTPEGVKAKEASLFYALDRYDSYKQNDSWRERLESGETIVFDRYTGSNIIHQAAKIDDPEEKKKFIDWLLDLEFNILGIPVPDMTFFLNLLPELSYTLMKDRPLKTKGTKDIHESNLAFLKKSYDNILNILAYGRQNNRRELDWKTIDCFVSDDCPSLNYTGRLHSASPTILRVEEIGEKITAASMKLFCTVS